VVSLVAAWLVEVVERRARIGAVGGWLVEVIQRRETRERGRIVAQLHQRRRPPRVDVEDQGPERAAA
jgi:hypothetical protein